MTTLNDLYTTQGDGRLFRQWLTNVRSLVDEQNLDCCIVITGYEGSGKSTLALKVADYLSQIANRQFDAANIAFDSDGFLSLIRTLAKGETAIFDEAANGLLGREAMTLDNRVTTTAAMVARARNLIWILLIPNLHNLDHYFREFRVKIWIHVSSRGEAVFHIAKRNPYYEGVWWQVFMRLQYGPLEGPVWDVYEERKLLYIGEKLAGDENRRKKKKGLIPDE